MNQQPTPEQQIHKAKLLLWLGIFLIILVGLSVAVFFIFVRPVGEGNVNTVVNTNAVENVNTTSNANVVVNINTVSATSSWQTYEDKTNGYSAKYPADYLIKSEVNGYIVFDSASIDSPNLTYLHISVTVEDNDFNTYRLGILTNPAVDNDSPINEEDVTIDGLDGKKITLKNALGETVIHYIVSYLGKVYDISAGDSVSADVISNFISNFQIGQLGDDVDIADTNTFIGKTCVSNNDCGAFPCVEGTCLVKECTDDSDCSAGTCGMYVTPVPGYCTTMDVL